MPSPARSEPAPGLGSPAKKELAMQLVSSAENSSLDWKAQYGYIEYNVERNEALSALPPGPMTCWSWFAITGK
jgi:hypothetical protein